MLVLGLALAGGFAAGAYRLSGVLATIRQDSLLRVKGYAEQKVRADTATWVSDITVRNDSLTNAFAVIDRQGGQLLAFIRDHKIAMDGVRRFPVDVQVVYRQTDNGVQTGTIDYYSLRQRVEVKSRDVAGVEAASRAASALLARGVEINSQAPAFTCSDVEKVKMDLLGRATRNATDRAASLANNSGARISGLVSAQQGVFQIVPADSTDVSDYGTYDTTTIEKTVKAVVTLEFAVRR